MVFPVIPYLAVDGAAEALDFYTTAFGATEVNRLEDGGKIVHAEFTIGESRFFLADEYAPLKVFSPTTLGGWSVSLCLEVDDADAFYARVVAAGATAERPVSDGPEPGTRAGWLVDPYGQRWMLSSAV